MTSDMGQEETVSLQETVSGDNLDSEVYDGQQFSIKAVSLNGEFDIGLSHAGGGEPPKEIVEPELYTPVEASVRAAIDIDAVKSHTTTEKWPELGSAMLDFRENGGIEVSIELRAE